MSFANVIGQMLQQGMAGQTHGRLQNFGGSAAGIGGVEQVLGALLGGGQPGAARSGAASGGGDLGALLGGILGGGQAAGQIGGQAGANPLGGLIGAVLGGGGQAASGTNPLGGMLGAMLGGGQRSAGAIPGGGALGGSAMAVLGTLAMSALQAYAKSAQAPVAAPDPAHAAELMAPGAERLVLRAMIGAAKADGRIDQTEIDRILAKADDGGITPAEKAFIEAELETPADPQAIAAEAGTPELAAQAYAASILAIDIDTEAERAYLRALAAALRLPEGAVRQLHQMTGAPLP